MMNASYELHVILYSTDVSLEHLYERRKKTNYDTRTERVLA
jgi:hypothetical protein